MKLCKDELKAKISEKVLDEDLAIELLEDIEDSVDVVEEVIPDTSELDAIKTELADLKKKYKERFLKSEEVEETKTDDEELEEKEIIDVKEI